MPLWFVDRFTSAKSLNKDFFLDIMEGHWNNWAAGKLSPAEIKSWKAIVKLVYTSNIRTMTGFHNPKTWAEITVHKVLFRDEFFQSRYAALAQIKFPDANLNEWEPNKNGPTDHPSFEKNKYMRQILLGREFEQARELSKRPWSCEPEEEHRSKRICSEAPSSTPETSVEPGSVTRGATPLISNPEDVIKVFGDLESQLASVRKAAEENTKIHQQVIEDLKSSHQQDIDSLQKKHQDDLKKHRKYSHDTIASIRETHCKETRAAEKAHEEKLSTLRAKCEGAISTLDKAWREGKTALQRARQEISKLNEDKN
ncbi:hypothetical protein FSARC_12763 [Fusarium sarcochroum]|uniref:Uncharacterized protein n=1 Tax=Fusarium sarcochroum TaxID=1208366 RepID=A0A8H4T658_9HYPO|nr:hypothetical protein FSARC_12763 [Fusarium sarcochroum]